MTETIAGRPSLTDRLVKEARDWLGTLAWAAPLYLVFSTFAFAAYGIPSESMVPTLEVGDRVVVSKFAYGYSRESAPFGLMHWAPSSDKRLFERLPKRGDVVVFMHPLKRMVMIKRLIGLPGDVIEVRHGVLIVNGEPVKLEQEGAVVRLAHEDGVENAVRRRETLPGGVVHEIDEFSDDSFADEYGPYTVPPRHLFFMGDNRDNSADSRFPTMGPVPIENLIGRAEMVWFTTHTCNKSVETACRARLFKPLAPES